MFLFGMMGIKRSIMMVTIMVSGGRPTWNSIA